MRWLTPKKLNREQRLETAKLLLSVCQFVILGIFASPFVPGLAALTFLDRIYGTLLVSVLYLLAMVLLKEVKNRS